MGSAGDDSEANEADQAEGVSDLISVIQNKDKLKNLLNLNLARNVFTKEKLGELVHALFYRKSLQHLDLSATNIDLDVIEDLCHSLRQMVNLKVLNLAKNKLGDGAEEPFANLLKSAVPQLRHLDLSGNIFSKKVIDTLKTVVKKATTILFTNSDS